jgi:hypothetical protein
MDSFNQYLNNLQNKNRENFSDFSGIKWLNTNTAQKAEKKRKKLIENLGNNLLFKDTKPYHKQISPGCKLCGEGKWSCLFITNKCNASCFYCPASQNTDEVPSSQNLNFETADAYAEYINYFGFKGVSFSGGEPLLFFDRTLEYLQRVREKCDPEIYIWMYTNGILSNEEKFRKLAAAGLNEVRFDIGATNYKLDKIAFAKGIIPTVTIEIPAVPEKKELIKNLLPEMIKAGVTILNLHQLRLTKHNAPNLLKHNYTYIHAEQPVVLESELAALEIVNFAHDQNLEIGINFCSFYFKNRFQKAGFRKQIANAFKKPDEILTEKGFIREFENENIDYKAVVISDNKNTFSNSSEIGLKNKTYFIKKESALKTLHLTPEQRLEVEELLKSNGIEIPDDQVLFKIWQMEFIEKGLREY